MGKKIGACLCEDGGHFEHICSNVYLFVFIFFSDFLFVQVCNQSIYFS